MRAGDEVLYEGRRVRLVVAEPDADGDVVVLGEDGCYHWAELQDLSPGPPPLHEAVSRAVGTTYTATLSDALREAYAPWGGLSAGEWRL